MTKRKGIIASILLVGYVVSTLLLTTQSVKADESKKWTVKEINEQRAVNLCPSDLDFWAQKKGYDISWELTPNKDTLIATVIRKDGAGKAYKKILAAGKVALSKYVDEAAEAVNDLPIDYVKGEVELNKKSIINHVNDEAVDGVMTTDTAKDMISAAMEKNDDLLLVSRYYYDSNDRSAYIAKVFMSKEGRGARYEISQAWNDADGKTNDGYSIKPDKKNKLGYYYKQNPISWGGIDYWELTLKPMYNR